MADAPDLPECFSRGFDQPKVTVRALVENARFLVELVVDEVEATDAADVSRYLLAQLPELPRARKRSSVTPVPDSG